VAGLVPNGEQVTIEGTTYTTFRNYNIRLEYTYWHMAELTRQNKRALALKAIYGADPLTRERFNLLHDHVDQYLGKMAELREEERLLTRWLDRCGELIQASRRAA